MRAIVWLAVAGCGRVGFGVGTSSDGATNEGYVATVLADHPLAYYRLDEAGGTVARDFSGHGYDGMYAVGGGQLGYAMPGALAGDPDTAVQLIGDGTTEAYVAFPSPVYTFGGDFTIEGWVVPAQPASGVNDAFFVWEIYNVSGFRTGWMDNLAPLLWTSESGGGGGVESPSPATVGVWNYLAFTRSGTTVSVYLAGQLVASGSPHYVVPPAMSNNSLGSAEGIPAGTSFDELAVYSYALDASRIAAHYAAAQ